MTYREFLLELAKLGKNSSENYITRPEFLSEFHKSPHNITNNTTNNIYRKKNKSNIVRGDKSPKDYVDKPTSKIVKLYNSSRKNCLGKSIKHRDNDIAVNQDDNNAEIEASQFKKQDNNLVVYCSEKIEKNIGKPEPPAPPTSPTPPETENPEKTAILEQPDKIIEEGGESRTQPKHASIKGNEIANELERNDIIFSDFERQKIAQEWEQELEQELSGKYVPVKNGKLVYGYTIHEGYDALEKVYEQFDLIYKQFQKLPKLFENHAYIKPKKQCDFRYFNDSEIAIMKMQYTGSQKDFRQLYRGETSLLVNFIDKNNILKLGADSNINLNFYQKGLFQYKILMPYYISKCEFQENGLFIPNNIKNNEYINRVVNLEHYNNVVKQLLTMFIGTRVLLYNFCFSDTTNILRFFDEDLKLIEKGKLSDEVIINAIILRMMCPKKQRYLGLKKMKYEGKILDTVYDGFVPPVFYYIITDRNKYVYQYMLNKAIKTFDNNLDVNFHQVLKWSEQLETLKNKTEKKKG